MKTSWDYEVEGVLLGYGGKDPVVKNEKGRSILFIDWFSPQGLYAIYNANARDSTLTIHDKTFRLLHIISS